MLDFVHCCIIGMFKSLSIHFIVVVQDSIGTNHGVSIMDLRIIASSALSDKDFTLSSLLDWHAGTCS